MGIHCGRRWQQMSILTQTIPFYVYWITQALVITALYFRWYTRQPKPKKLNHKEYYEAPCDLLITWGRPDFFTWIVETLIWLKDGVKMPPTHAMHVFEKSRIMSAETSGYKILDLRTRLQKCRRIIVFRIKDLPILQEIRIHEHGEKFQGRGYDYWMYGLIAIRVSIFFIPVFFYLKRKLPLADSLVLLVVLLFVYYPVKFLLRKLEKASLACSEAETIILSNAGVLTGLTDGTTVAPHHLLWIYLNNPGKFECVYDSAGEYWKDE